MITKAVENLCSTFLQLAQGFVWVWVRYQVQSAGQILAQGCQGGAWIGGVGVGGLMCCARMEGGAANVWVINFGRCNE